MSGSCCVSLFGLKSLVLPCIRPGEIINWVALDREQHSQHSLKVMVTDQGHPRLNATASVQILVTDVNDNAPQFTHLPASKELSLQVGTRPFGLLAHPSIHNYTTHPLSYKVIFQKVWPLENYSVP